MTRYAARQPRRSKPLLPPRSGRARRSGGASTQPAYVIDAAAGAIVEANGAGWAAWGLDAGLVGAPVAIDKAMPALHRLGQIAEGAEGPVEGERLTFWGSRGLLQMRCQVQRVEPGNSLLLVRALEVQSHEPAAATGAATIGEGARLDAAAAARLAHELRTPLAAVIAYAEVLKDEHFGPIANPRYREYARHIHDSARHALGVVDGLLAGPATEAGVPELAFRDLDPAGVVENCLAVARPLADEAGLDLIAQVCPRAPRVVADELSLKQMLLNLITNAIKFARPGDKVTVGVAYDLNGPLRFAVADTGPGMSLSPPPEEARGGRAKNRAGLGIGLPLTRALAEANGAALSIDSAPGRGTCVTIAFGKDRVVPV